MGRTFSQIYNQCADDVGDTTTSYITHIKKVVNDVGRSLFQRMGLAHKRRVADITLVASTQYYEMSDIASDWDEDTPVVIYYRDSANRRQDLDCFDDNEWQDEEDTDEGDIYGFNINKKAGTWRVYFTYVPNGAFVSNYSPLKMEYQIKWTELSSDSDEPDLPDSHRQLMIYRVNEILCTGQGDSEGVALWKGLADKEEGLLFAKQARRKGKPKRVYPHHSITISGRPFKARDYN